MYMYVGIVSRLKFVGYFNKKLHLLDNNLGTFALNLAYLLNDLIGRSYHVP
jgi:hypothetical protein